MLCPWKAPGLVRRQDVSPPAREKCHDNQRKKRETIQASGRSSEAFCYETGLGSPYTSSESPDALLEERLCGS
jgi:hypothetical protein